MAINIKQQQQLLKEAGFYDGLIDGDWGSMSKTAFDNALEAARLSSKCNIATTVPHANQQIVWGAKVSPTFKDRVSWIADALQMPLLGASWLMAAMAWESNETFKPNVKNMAGSGATGLIQFMPLTAISLGTTVDKLAVMTAEDQLNYVYKYFAPRRGKLNSLGDVYMAILWPLGIGKPDSYVLWNKSTRPTTYRQNSGLDLNRDGAITKAEAVAKVAEKLKKGNQYLG